MAHHRGCVKRPQIGDSFNCRLNPATLTLPLVQEYDDAEVVRGARGGAPDDDGSTVRLASLNDTVAGSPPPAPTCSAVRPDVYRTVSELTEVEKNPQTPADAKSQAKTISANLRPSVEYAPWWVRILSALCLGIGTMIGYRRIMRMLGERVGNTHLAPAQGASAELVGAGLIATAGFTGLPVSTTHIITSGIAGTMIGSGSGSIAAPSCASWQPGCSPC